MEVKTKDLWVFVETNPDGSAKNVGIELLTPGRLMADKQGGDLVAVVLGKDVSAAVKEINEHGADQIIVVEGPEFEEYTTDAYTIALVELIEKYAPTSVLIGATPNGRDLGPRISCRLKTGLTADCTELDVDEETGNVLWTRPAIGGNLMAQIQCPEHRPQMGTVRPGVFHKSAPVEGHATITSETVHVSPEDIRTKVIEVIDRTRSARPERPSGRDCTSPAASPVPSSTPPASRERRPSSPSTTTRTPPSSAWRTTASSATCSRSSPNSSGS